MLPLPHWRRELDGQLARTNTPHRLWRLRLVAACAAEELHGPRGEDAPRASPSRTGVVGGVRPRARTANPRNSYREIDDRIPTKS